MKAALYLILVLVARAVPDFNTSFDETNGNYEIKPTPSAASYVDPNIMRRIVPSIIVLRDGLDMSHLARSGLFSSSSQAQPGFIRYRCPVNWVNPALSPIGAISGYGMAFSGFDDGYIVLMEHRIYEPRLTFTPALPGRPHSVPDSGTTFLGVVVGLLAVASIKSFVL